MTEGNEDKERYKFHNALFHKTFALADHAAAEFRAILPKKLLERIDLETLDLRPGNFFDTRLSGSETDLLYSVKVAGKPGFLYVLFEHQSGVDPLMPLRLCKYIIRILEDFVSEAKRKKEPVRPLPLVIPVVLYHGEQGWTPDRTLHDLFDKELMQEAELPQFVPQLSFVLEDLGELSDEQLHQRGLDLVVRLAMWLLRDARNARRLTNSMGYWLNELIRLAQDPGEREALYTLFSYIYGVVDQELAEQMHQAVEAAAPDTKGELMTLAEKWMAEGRAEGRTEGEAKLLLKQLTIRFVSVPEDLQKRVTSASEEELSRWAERVLTADSLQAVFSD